MAMFIMLALGSQLVLFGQFSFDMSSAVKLEGLLELQSGFKKLLSLPQILNANSTWGKRVGYTSNETYLYLQHLLDGCGRLCDVSDPLEEQEAHKAINCSGVYLKAIDPLRLSQGNSVHQLVWKHFSHFGKVSLDPRLVISPYVGGIRQVRDSERGRGKRSWSFDKVQELVKQCKSENIAGSSMVLFSCCSCYAITDALHLSNPFDAP
eukprot:753012-Hanusia_phi.AAC.3